MKYLVNDQREVDKIKITAVELKSLRFAERGPFVCSDGSRLKRQLIKIRYGG